jgi:DNA-binding MarR family transcriptional regulator
MDAHPNDQAKRLLGSIRALVRRFSLAERADVSCCGMTVAQATTLEALVAGDLRLSELSRRLGITASTLTRNLARLQERGLVTLTTDPSDCRARLISLTAAGKLAAGAVRTQEETFAQSVLENLPGERTGEVLNALDELMVAIRCATESCCPGAYDHLMTEISVSHKRRNQ